MRGFVLIFLSISFLLSQVSSQSRDASAFQNLWEALNQYICEPFLKSDEVATPPKFIVLESVGFGINPDDFDPERWVLQGFKTRSPAHNTFVLSDSVFAYGSRAADTGYKLSQLWNGLLRNGQTISPLEDPQRQEHLNQAFSALVDQIRFYALSEEQRAALENATQPTPESTGATTTTTNTNPSDKSEQELLDEYSKSLQSIYLLRNKMLDYDNVDPRIVSLRLRKYSQMVSTTLLNWDRQKQSNRLAQSIIQSTTSTDLGYHLADAQKEAMLSRRAEVGTSGFLSSYYVVNAVPADWWTWWTKSPKSLESFTRFTYSTSQTSNSVVRTYNRLFGTNDPSNDRSWVQVTSPDPADASIVGSMSVDEASSSAILVTMDLGVVQFERPWLDESLLRLNPLAITGLDIGAWSSGFVQSDFKSVNEMCPTYTTGMIVARNILITSSGWSPRMLQAIQRAAEPNSNLSVSVGPFSFGGPARMTTEVPTQPASIDASGNRIAFEVPQVLGWVVRRPPLFPNADMEVIYNRTQLLRSISGLPLPPEPTRVQEISSGGLETSQPQQKRVSTIRRRSAVTSDTPTKPQHPARLKFWDLHNPSSSFPEVETPPAIPHVTVKEHLRSRVNSLPNDFLTSFNPLESLRKNAEKRSQLPFTDYPISFTRFPSPRERKVPSV